MAHPLFLSDSLPPRTVLRRPSCLPTPADKPQPIIPKGWIWLYWLNPVSYTLYGLVVGELGDNQDIMQVRAPHTTGGQAFQACLF